MATKAIYISDAEQERYIRIQKELGINTDLSEQVKTCFKNYLEQKEIEIKRGVCNGESSGSSI